MNIIKADVFEIDEQDILKKIERCGRVCYKSEEQIQTGSAFDFVNMLVKREHFAMLEHAPVVLRVTKRIASTIRNLGHGTFLHVTLNERDQRYLISGNIRAFHTLLHSHELFKDSADDISRVAIYLQSSLGTELYTLFFGPDCVCSGVDDRNYMLTQEEILALPCLTYDEAHEHLYLTALFICDRGVSHELVRMRGASFAQESTRYCNYKKDKFGKDITVIDPGFIGNAKMQWLSACQHAEETYFNLLDWGLMPQMARAVLPNSLKTEVVMTCNLTEWQHTINLRYHGTTGSPHPQMKEIMAIWFALIKAKKGYCDWII